MIYIANKIPGGETAARPRAGWALLGWVALCFAAAATGAFVSTKGWYEGLLKPSWNPPAWVFGPVWTLLYAMMAVAAWLVWREGGWARQKKPLRLFLVQWALNAAWTPIFFGFHQIGPALAEIMLLWIMLVLTINAFVQVSRVAAVLLLPYLAWVSFATALNFALWRLNAAP